MLSSGFWGVRDQIFLSGTGPCQRALALPPRPMKRASVGVQLKGFAVLLYHPCCTPLWEPCSCCSHSPGTSEDEHHAPFPKRPFPFKSTSKNGIKSLKRRLKKMACKKTYIILVNVLGPFSVFIF